MAKNKDGESSSSGSISSLVQKDNKLMQDLLSQVNEYSEKLRKGMEELSKKKVNEGPAELGLAQSVEKDRERFMHHLAELVQVISKPQHRETVIADVEAMEEKTEGEENDVLDTIEMLIESFKQYSKEYINAKMAKVEKYKQEAECVVYTVDGMLTRLSEVAQRVIELKDKKCP